MTQVTIACRDRYDIDVRGHAGFDPGNDIVCASISTLTYTLVNVAYSKLTDLHISDGHMILAMPKDTQTAEWLKMYRIGIAALAEQYPTNVSLKEVGRFDEA